VEWLRRLEYGGYCWGVAMMAIGSNQAGLRSRLRSLGRVECQVAGHPGADRLITDIPRISAGEQRAIGVAGRGCAADRSLR
jgi:hypothetical protein